MPTPNAAPNDDLVLLDDIADVSAQHTPWYVLVVDDDEEIHNVTRYALSNYVFQEKRLNILSAFSGAEARTILSENPSIALALIDVVMESDNEGLRLVEYIRNDLKNEFTRLVLRTGQPGQAPEYEVITKYDINDYKNKVELTNTRLLTLVTTALRSFADITDLDHLRKNLEQQVHIRTAELSTTNEQLQAISLEKDELLGIVAHDLKNPLNVMLNVVGLYEGFGELTREQVQDLLKMVGTSSEKMLKLITKLLDVNALEQGKFAMNLITCHPATIIPHTVDFARFRADAKHIKLHFSSTADDLSAIIDEQAFGQVMENLLSNAVKYSPPNKNVFVEANKHVSAGNPATLRISVRDEGPGISADDMKKLFGKFMRLTAQPTGGEDSTGLGLAIVKKMVEAMNGKVWCESEAGDGLPTGATFIVELPVV
jgi:signal transduction histidine kinase